MSEHDIQSSILVGCSHGSTRLFRNQVGAAWCGEATKGPSKYSMRLNAGDVFIRDARFLSAGLGKGSPDLVGWHTIEITSDMVGKKMAIFVGLEVKDAKGKATPEQTNFIEQIRAAGGIAGIVRSLDTAQELLK